MEERKRVCILEDNDDIREIIEFLLESENYEVFTYPTVSAFLKEAIGHKPHVCVLDVMLPDGNGIEVCKGIKNNLATCSIPVVIMSANYSGDDVRQSCMAQDFIRKPFDIGDFVKRVDAQIRN